jgi:hypothetical protein
MWRDEKSENFGTLSKKPMARVRAGTERSMEKLDSGAKYDVWAAVCCVLIGAVALYVAALRQVGNWGVETDFYGTYAPLASGILAGHPYTYAHYPPGYMILLAAGSLVSPDLFAVAKVISAIATACLGWISYLLLKRLFSGREAFVTTLFVLFALLPYSYLAATDMPANLLLVIPLWLVLRGNITIADCVQAGIAAGLAYVVRYNAVFVIAGIPAALIVVNPNCESLRQRISKSSAFLAAAFVATLPWLAYNWQVNGSPFASDMHAQIAAHFFHPKGDAHGWALNEMGRSFSSIASVLMHDPSTWILTYAKDVLQNRAVRLSLDVLAFPAYLFAGAGLLVRLVSVTRAQLVCVFVCALGYALHGLASFAPRFYFFLFPLLFLCVTSVPFFFLDGFATGHLQDARKRLALSWGLCALLVATSAYTSYATVSRALSTEPSYLLEAARVLKARADPDDLIMAVEPHIGYLTGLKVIAAQVADSWELYARKAREGGARYVVYSDHEQTYWKGLGALKDSTQAPPPFRLIYKHEPSRTLIYEIDE